MNSAPDDSLDNLSILQNSKYKQLQAQIKQQFTSALQKLQSSETREIVSIIQNRPQANLENSLKITENLNISETTQPF